MKKLKSFVASFLLIAVGVCGGMAITANIQNVSATSEEYSAFDVNKDGNVNVFDLVMLKNYLLGIDEEPVQEKSYDATGTLVRVVDGDTYILNIDGAETRVRLIGVDTPESVAPPSYYKDNTEEGVAVSQIVKDKMKAGDTIYIEYDVNRQDKYSRTLAYLYFEDGTMVQEWLLTNGYAQVMTIQPNSKYADKFIEMEQKAMEEKVGLWIDAEN